MGIKNRARENYFSEDRGEYIYRFVDGPHAVPLSEIPPDLQRQLALLDKQKNNADDVYDKHNKDLAILDTDSTIAIQNDLNGNVLSFLINANDRRADLEACLAIFRALTMKQQMLFHRFFILGMTKVAIAKALGISERSVRAQLCAIRKRLAKVTNMNSCS